MIFAYVFLIGLGLYFAVQHKRLARRYYSLHKRLGFTGSSRMSELFNLVVGAGMALVAAVLLLLELI